MKDTDTILSVENFRSWLESKDPRLFVRFGMPRECILTTYMREHNAPRGHSSWSYIINGVEYHGYNLRGKQTETDERLVKLFDLIKEKVRYGDVLNAIHLYQKEKK